MCSRFSSVDVSRLSTQTTRCPSASRYSQRWEPRNPAPPVTTQVLIDRTVVPRSPEWLASLRGLTKSLRRANARPARPMERERATWKPSDAHVDLTWVHTWIEIELNPVLFVQPV